MQGVVAKAHSTIKARAAVAMATLPVALLVGVILKRLLWQRRRVLINVRRSQFVSVNMNASMHSASRSSMPHHKSAARSNMSLREVATSNQVVRELADALHEIGDAHIVSDAEAFEFVDVLGQSVAVHSSGLS